MNKPVTPVASLIFSQIGAEGTIRVCEIAENAVSTIMQSGSEVPPQEILGVAFHLMSTIIGAAEGVDSGEGADYMFAVMLTLCGEAYVTGVANAETISMEEAEKVLDKFRDMLNKN
jgi:hypothetical protein